MSTLHPPHREKDDASRHEVGLAAFGTCEKWNVAVDHADTDPEAWFLQIEGPPFYLYLRLAGPHIVRDAHAFLGRVSSNSGPVSLGSDTCNELALGAFAGVPVTLVLDDEYNDRCYVTIGQSADSHLRFPLSGDDLKKLGTALKHAAEELETEGTG